MAIRLKNGGDKNRRFKINLDSLSANQSGYLNVSNLKQNGKPVQTKESGTILEVTLNEPLASGAIYCFGLEFEGHVPDVIRRAGKNSKEGVAFSMAQWYPKLSEYDVDGWNTDPYTGREFHGVWGNFDVKITLTKTLPLAVVDIFKMLIKLERDIVIANGQNLKKEKSLGIL